MAQFKSILGGIFLAMITSLCFGQGPCGKASFHHEDSIVDIDIMELKHKFISTADVSDMTTVDYRWTVDGVLKGYSKDFYYYTNTPGTVEIRHAVIDQANNCGDSITLTFNKSKSTSCGLNFTAKDTLESCKWMFVLDPYNSDIDSVFFNLGDGTIKRYVYQSLYEDTIFHKYADSGSQTIEMTTYGFNGKCESFERKVINVKDCDGKWQCNSFISGRVYPDTTAFLLDSSKFNFPRHYYFTNYTAWLIQKKGNMLSVVDSIVVDSVVNSGYIFRDLCVDDTFLVKVALNSNHEFYSDFMPTYHRNSLNWDFASPVVVSKQNTAYRLKSVDIIIGNNPGGKGFVAGNVNRGANKRAGEPVRGVEIMLLNELRQPVAYAMSKSDGSFRIENLAMGEYHIYAEIPGLEVAELNFELDEENPSLEKIKVEVNSKKVTTSINRRGLIVEKQLIIYPNPARDYLTIETDGLNGMLSIIDLSGRVLVQKEVEDVASINTSSIEPGLYIVSFRGANNGVVYQQIIIE